MIVVNSSPIISFGKQGVLELLKKCFKRIIIPESVYGEVILRKGSPESIALEKAIKDKWIIVEKADINPLLNTKKIAKGEKEAISLAAKYKTILLIDDDSAKTYASILGVEAHGTFFVIYLACVKNFIDKEEAKQILQGMIKDGFYISTELYLRFLDLLDSL